MGRAGAAQSSGRWPLGAALAQKLVEVFLTDAVAGAVAERDALEHACPAPASDGVERNLKVLSGLRDSQKAWRSFGHGVEHTRLYHTNSICDVRCLALLSVRMRY